MLPAYFPAARAVPAVLRSAPGSSALGAVLPALRSASQIAHTLYNEHKLTTPPVFSRPEDILKFWRAVEFFSPQNVPKANPAARMDPVEIIQENALLPWNEEHRWVKRRRPFGTASRFTLYCGIYGLNGVSTLLEDAFGKNDDSADERMDGEGCLFALLLTKEGRPLLDSITLSSAAWAVSRTLSPGPNSSAWLDGFEEESQRIVGLIGARLAPDRDDERAKELAEKSFLVGKPLSVKDIQDVNALVARELGVTGVLRPAEIRVRYGLVASRKPYSVDDNDFLNSFFLRDLRNVSHQVGRGKAGAGLRAYLSLPKTVSNGRIDVRERLDIPFQLLSPHLFPKGRWPSVGHHPLVFSQQFAVNTALSSLAEPGLFAVNGPPGTGKTTLLRDIVAAIVVERAIQLAKLKAPADAFTGKLNWRVSKFTRSIATWRSELQGFEIVVASSNNGAVENVTREIPGKQAIDEAWTKEADYFAVYGSRILGEEAWAMIAARLGNKANRSEFLSRFWHAEETEEDGVSKKTIAQIKPEDGFRKLLKSLEDETISWTTAVKHFRKASAEEDRLRQARQKTYDLFGLIRDSEEKLANAPHTEKKLADQLDFSRERKSQTQSALTRIQAEFQVKTARHEEHLRLKPNWIEVLFSFGKVNREWRVKEQTLSQAVAHVENQIHLSTQVVSETAIAMLDVEKRLRLHHETTVQLSTQTQGAKAVLREAQTQFPSTPDPERWRDHEEERELSAPWADHAWNEARARVFLAALRLHKAFIVANAETMRQSLHAATDILAGAVPDNAPPEAVRAAWTTLFFVIPVISTTFASFDRLFSHLGQESLGYLLIDEAGQAVPQAAAGAIWRAKRTLVVGDPLQLEPIVTLPFTAQQALRRHFRVDEQWLPSRTSAQLLADRVNLYGTYVPTSEGSLWVGSPLRVHRRCDQPMFDISNNVAYDGLMVFGTATNATLSYPKSGWIDIASTGADGHFIPAEGEATRQLVQGLINQGLDVEKIFVISPFRAVVRELKQLLPEVKVGTVHTTQGKESDVVILVLGGNPARPGVKSWASERPNLLNVAVSRAKRRLYVIGDREGWKTYPYFSVLAQKLPVIQL
jgi:AAA domain